VRGAGVGRICLISGLFALSAGCQPASVQEIVGPDGSAMLHVSCGSDQGRCYALAGTRCPNGYEIFPAAGAPGNFLVRCISYPPASAWAAAPPASPPSSWTQSEPAASRAQEPQAAEAWPPLESPNAPASIAPPPPPAPTTTSASVAPAETSQKTSPPKPARVLEIDLGY